jgi:hypothetical protein
LPYFEIASKYKRAHELVSNGFLFSDKGLGLLYGPTTRLVGKLSSKEITPLIFSLGFQQDDKDKLSPSIRVFCESLRQQLSKPFGLVCPFAYKGQVRCGKNELLLRLFERLPEEVNSNFEKPNCDRIR